MANHMNHAKSGIAALLLADSIAAHAALVQVTYAVSGTGFLDSNNNPPSAPTSTTIGGTFSFTFDADPLASQTGITPDSVIDFDITRSDGLMIDFDTSDTAARVVTVGGPGNPKRVTFGGSVSGEHQLVGLTEPGDFRVIFDISRTTFEVTSLFDPFGFVFLTRFDPFYHATSWSAQLVFVQAIPLPPAALMLGPALGLLFVGRARGGRTSP